MHMRILEPFAMTQGFAMHDIMFSARFETL